MPRFEQDFAGIPDVPHVADSSRPFAAIVSAVTGFDVGAVQDTLNEAGIPRPDETLGSIRLEGMKNGFKEAVTFRPLPLRGAIGPDGILGRIMAQLDEGDAVALYHREDRGRNSPHKWLLLSGGSVDEGGTPRVVQAVDPERAHKNYFARHNLLDLIAQSTRDPKPPRGPARLAHRFVDYVTGADLERPTTGIYAYAVTEHIYRPLTLLFEDEPERRSDGDCSATGQDKIVWQKPDAESEANPSEAEASPDAGPASPDA